MRDTRSAELALSIGVDRAVVIPDLAWGTSVIDDARPPVIDGQLGLSLRPWTNAKTTDQFASNIAGAIDLLVADGVISRVVGVPMSVDANPGADDRRVLSHVMHRIESGIPAQVAEVSSRRDAEIALAESRAVLAMRLHAMILAASLGTRTVGIAYDKKVSSVAASTRGPSVALNASPEEIAAAIHCAMAAPAPLPPEASTQQVTDQLIALPTTSVLEVRRPSARVLSLERVLVSLGF